MLSGTPPGAADPFCHNEFEVETSAIALEDEEGAPDCMCWLWHALRSHGRLWRRLLAWSTLPLALLLVLNLIVAQTTPQAAAPALLQMHAPPMSLGAVPAYCLGRSKPRPLLPNVSPVLGAAPVWVAGFDGPRAALHIAYPDPATATRYGWIAQVLWEVAPDFSDVVFIQGKDLRSGAPLWLRIPNQAAATLLVLDPTVSHTASAVGSGWAEWQGEVYIAAASCYSLEAWWPGGHWTMTFAAGLGTEQITAPEHLCRGQEAPCIPGEP